MRTLTTLLIGAALLVLAACSQATPDPKDLTDPFFLDMHATAGTPTATGPVLASGVDYVVKVEGTHSSWSVDEWALGVCKGDAEDLPTFPSLGVVNSQVGMDAVWVFAAPNGSSRCAFDLPFRGSGVRMSLDGGATHTDLGDITGGTGPSADHTYEYEATGSGKSLVISRVSGNPSNNYGMLKITVREAGDVMR